MLASSEVASVSLKGKELAGGEGIQAGVRHIEIIKGEKAQSPCFSLRGSVYRTIHQDPKGTQTGRV